MKRPLKLILIGLLVLAIHVPLVWGYGPPRKGYKNMEETPHLRLHWNCLSTEENTMEIQGVVEVKSQAGTPVYHLQLSLIGFDRKGKEINQQPFEAGKIVLQDTESLPFSISLPLQGEEVQFGLWVFYRFNPVYGGAGKRASLIRYLEETWYWTFQNICPQD